MTIQTRPKSSLGLALFLVSFAAATTAANLQPVHVEGGTITHRTARQQGFYEKYGIDIKPEDSGTGAAMIERMGKGIVEIVDGGLDNGIAGAASGLDIVVISQSSLAGQVLVGQPGTKSARDLKGKTIAVDSTNMQAALLLKKMLLLAGLNSGQDYELEVVGSNRLKAMRENKKYAAAILSVAQAELAKTEGFVNLGNTLDIVGKVPYHGSFVRSSWASRNADLLVRYIAAEIEAQRWLLAPENKAQVLAIIRKPSMPGTTDAMVEESYRDQVSGAGPLTKDLKLDVSALENFLKLRAEIEGSWNGKAPPAKSLYDLSYYNKALALVATKK